jgi:hypothetical protein
MPSSAGRTKTSLELKKKFHVRETCSKNTKNNIQEQQYQEIKS